jgi:hypothetical protein
VDRIDGLQLLYNCCSKAAASRRLSEDAGKGTFVLKKPAKDPRGDAEKMALTYGPIYQFLH